MNHFGRAALVVATVLLTARIAHHAKLPPNETITVSSEKETTAHTSATVPTTTN